MDRVECDLFESKLVLCRGLYKPGDGCCKDNFLCAEIDDEDLPWDTNKTDW
jgi:hypothetical protein